MNWPWGWDTWKTSPTCSRYDDNDGGMINAEIFFFSFHNAVGGKRKIVMFGQGYLFALEWEVNIESSFWRRVNS